MSVSKTMRLSDDVLGFIGGFDGENFTDKFETMVRYFRDIMPHYQRQLESAKKEVESVNSKLSKARANLKGIEMINCSFERLKSDMVSASACIEDFVTRNKV